jgi:outer membrane protein OmpA-like peptidoglycan-associated protein
MSRSPLFLLAILAVSTPAATYAQHGGTIELGAFARWSHYDDALGLDDAMGYGGRAGIFFSSKLLFEGDAGLVPTKAGSVDVDHVPAHIRLVGNFPFTKRMAFLFGGGWAYNKFSPSGGTSETENGVGALAGLRISLGKRLSLRGEAIADYMFDHASASSGATLHYALQAGASLQLFGGPGDKDKDGVKDNADRCPNTPRDTPVETTGCPDADRDGIADTVDRCPQSPAGRTVDAIGCTDVDGDGVVDPQDRCADTPTGTRVDATGCPMDSDRDGVADTSDRCPGTPAGVRVDPATGCPVDSDGDGVVDAQDKCPGTAAGIPVDPTGCAPDADGDGVADAADTCPNTPAGAAVDAAGCPAAGPVVLEGVTFLTGSSKLTLNSQGPLDRVVTALRDRPELRVVIEGHTDNVGNRDANLRLSKARADAVRAYFIAKGIAASRLTAVGIGPDQPIAPNDTEEGRAKNRRIQLREVP